ncbi:MAG TPA: hypothetical protein VNY09_06505 [Candidatus Sulfotelmatobacter sp.]|jgi:hypothetical protein|nr:hypothetical protein [Candidatus Sulfotelmatobacter sp.]
MRRDERIGRKRTAEAKKSSAKPPDRSIEELIATYYDEASEEIRLEERAWGEFSVAQFREDD